MKLPDIYAQQKRIQSLEALVAELLRKLGGRVTIMRRDLMDVPNSREFYTSENPSEGSFTLKLLKGSKPLAEIARETPIRTPLESALVDISIKERAAEIERDNEELAWMMSESALFEGWAEGIKKGRENKK